MNDLSLINDIINLKQNKQLSQTALKTTFKERKEETDRRRKEEQKSTEERGKKKRS